MNVRVGDIIKLENNQFVAVRDGCPSRPTSLQRKESSVVHCCLLNTYGRKLPCVESSPVLLAHLGVTPFWPFVLGAEQTQTLREGLEKTRKECIVTQDGLRAPHQAFSPGGSPPPLQQRAPRAVLHRDSGAGWVSRTPCLTGLLSPGGSKACFWEEVSGSGICTLWKIMGSKV